MRGRSWASRWRVSAIAVAVALAGATRGAGPTRDPGVSGRNGETAGFEEALQLREFEFPQDHGPHPGFRQEWWYVTGNLDATTGERFGFELTIFRFALAPPAPQSGASRWRTRQIYLAHFAITDVGRNRFRFAQKLSRGALGLAGAEAPPLRVWIDDWSLGVVPGASDAHWSLRAAQAGYELSLEAQPLMPPVLNGDKGLSRKSNEPGSANYYYSIPRVAVRGRLVRDGHPVDVQGLAWLDREWGSGSLGRYEQGWDWFALQLRDGGTLMFYSLRNRDGSRDPNSAGTWVDTAGRSRALASGEVQIDVGDYWTNARGERYPARWHVRVPSVGLDVDVHPVIANQELGTTPRYWEGAVDVSGSRSGQKIDGRGYVELVGYARAAEGGAATGNGARGTGR